MPNKRAEKQQVEYTYIASGQLSLVLAAQRLTLSGS
jgi:YD repeat-containing protein